MAFEPKLESGEEVLDDILVTFEKEAGLRLVLTNRGVFWPGKKTFAVSDPVTTERLSLSEIERFSYRAKSKVGSAIAGLLLTIVGLFMTFGEYFETGAIWVGLPQALVVGGVVIAAMGGRRKSLRIQGGKSKMTWSAPIVFGKRSNDELGQLEARLRAWVTTVGRSLDD